MMRYLLCVSVALVLTANVASAQGTRPAKKRRLAPGVLTVIGVDGKEGETFTGPTPLIEIATRGGLNWDPAFTPKSRTILEMSKKIVLRRSIWNLEFAFKPLRMVEVDVPDANARMERKLIWYMVYRIRYLGADLVPAGKEDAFGNITFPSTTPGLASSVRFFPKFTLESHDYKKSYLDRVIPSALAPIAKREKVTEKLHNSVQIGTVKLLPSNANADNSVWGVATWEAVDPRIDYFSVYVKGLTNAYRFVDPAGAYKPGDPPGTGRKFTYKHLQINFWRPGDSVFEHESEIRYGVPIESSEKKQQALLKLYGLGEERVDYRWVYR